jgi:hypothetical protein
MEEAKVGMTARSTATARTTATWTTSKQQHNRYQGQQ